MTNSNSNPLRSGDLFIVQRKATYTSGPASSDVYTVSAEGVGNFLSGYVIADLKDIKDDIAELKLVVETLKSGIDTALVAFDKLSDRMITIERVVGDNVVRLNTVEEEVRSSLVRAKINFYHELQDSLTLNPGEMAVLSSPNVLATSFSEVTILRYHTETKEGVVNNFEFVFEKDTVELTNFSNTSATLIHRVIFNILEQPVTITDPVTGDMYSEFKVKSKRIGGPMTGLPFYNSAQDNPIRSDFYPISTEEFDSVEALLEDYVPIRGDVIKYGKLTLTSDTGQRAKLTFDATQGVDVVYKAILKFKNKNDDTLFTLGEEVVNVYGKLNMHNSQIKDLAVCTSPNDAATKKYVDEALEQFDVTAEDLFKPGDQVAGTVASRAEVYGFFVEGGSLYFKTGA